MTPALYTYLTVPLGTPESHAALSALEQQSRWDYMSLREDLIEACGGEFTPKAVKTASIASPYLRDWAKELVVEMEKRA